jgi:hypothetical protein
MTAFRGRETNHRSGRSRVMRLAVLIFAGLAAASLARTAEASAVFAWVPDDPNGCCKGVLELSDEAFLAGGASWTPGFPLDANPVERFHFEGRFKVRDLQPATEAERDVDLIVSFAATPETARCCGWDFQLNVQGEGLSGRLRVTTQNDDIIMSGGAGGWNIERAGSDAISSGVICGAGASAACTGARGRWVLISRPGGVHKTGGHRVESRPIEANFHLR